MVDDEDNTYNNIANQDNDDPDLKYLSDYDFDKTSNDDLQNNIDMGRSESMHVRSDSDNILVGAGIDG